MSTKRSLLAAASLLIVIIAPAAFAGSYDGTLTGKALWRSVPGMIGWAGESAGSRAAEFNVTLNWANGQPTFNGGEWTLTVNTVNADQTSTYVGALRGTISGGVVALDQNGEIASMTDASLNVVAGYGAYGGVTSGSGTLTAAITSDPEPFRGSMTLSW